MASIHDARMFKDFKYTLMDEIDYSLKKKKQKILDTVILADSKDLIEYVADGVVSLIVTSPPYNVNKSYEEELTLQEYLDYLKPIWIEAYRILRTGGRLCVNCTGVGRDPYIPLPFYIAIQLITLKYMMRGVIIWEKGAGVGTSTAWGSWMSPSDPTLRDVNEFILVFSKENWHLKKDKHDPDITRDEFLEFTKNSWEMPTASTKIGHPAPFSTVLPERLIKFYTYPNDLVADIFNGAGATCIAAKMLGRHYLGFDIVQEYVDKANERLDNFGKCETL